MSTLTGNKIRHTYYKLLQVDNGQIVQNGLGAPVTGSINLSGSLHITGSASVGGDLRVHGRVTAEEFITTTISSSVIYQSGSTQFGDTQDDSHNFTGSVNITGSQHLTGNSVIDGDLTQNGTLVNTGSLDVSGSINVEGEASIVEGVYGSFFVNPQTITRNIVVQPNYNGTLYGPITIDEGKTMEIGANSKIQIIDL